MYNQSDLIKACHGALYPIDISELELKVAWSDSSNMPVLIFDQIDWYFTERGFSTGSRYISNYVDVGCIPEGRQRMFKALLEKFNTNFDMDLSY
jgi:hypothetical protein